MTNGDDTTIPNRRNAPDAVSPRQFEWTGTSPTADVVEAVSTATGRALTALPPLYDAVDPDALDALLAPDDGPSRRPISVEFVYAGVEVRAHSNEGIQIIPISDGLD